MRCGVSLACKMQPVLGPRRCLELFDWCWINQTDLCRAALPCLIDTLRSVPVVNCKFSFEVDFIAAKRQGGKRPKLAMCASIL